MSDGRTVARGHAERTPIDRELISGAIAILAQHDVAGHEIESRMHVLCGDALLARRLIDWLPEVFGFVLVGHVADIRLPKGFSAKSQDDRWITFAHNAEPIIAMALPMASDMLHKAQMREVFSRIALRSSSAAALDRALSAMPIDALHGSELGNIAMIGIPAECYFMPDR